jgi:5-methylcytosine-specific restriction endonuclease McrA
MRSLATNRDSVKADLRHRLFLAFGFKCQWCGAFHGSSHGRNWTIDRIRPGGPYCPANVTLACRSCNSKKRDHYWPTDRSLAAAELRGELLGLKERYSFLTEWLMEPLP